MNILQLRENGEETTNLSTVINHLDYNVIDKFKLNNISLVSYDAFIITIDFLSKNYENNIIFFDNLKKQKKPIIYVYHSKNKPDEDLGMKILSDKYKIKFKLSDCSVLDTSSWNYKPAIYGIYDEALSMNSTLCKGYCSVKNTNQFYILKKKNIIIMHDLYIRYFGIERLDISKMPNMIKFILQTDEEESEEKVDWLSNINILDDEKIISKLNNNQEELKKLLEENNTLNERIKQNEFYKTILYSSGNQLVETVKIILEEMLNITIDDTDLKKQDLYFIINNKNILVEVKGVNHPFQRDNIAQVKRHVRDYAEEHEIYGADVEKLCKGVIILNPYSLHNLKDKISKEFYSKEVIEDAEYEKVCTLDTLTLLNYYSKWKKDPKSIDIKNIILNTNYNKPDYDEIIKL